MEIPIIREVPDRAHLFSIPSLAWHINTCMCVLSHVQLFATLWTITRLLCPWDSPGKHTGVDCHFLLQRIFLTQRSNPHLLHCRQILCCLSHQGSHTSSMMHKQQIVRSPCVYFFPRKWLSSASICVLNIDYILQGLC